MQFIKISDNIIVNLAHVVDTWRSGDGPTSTLVLNVTNSPDSTLNVSTKYEKTFLNALSLPTDTTI